MALWQSDTAEVEIAAITILPLQTVVFAAIGQAPM
jgi:hypothetical protein